MLNRGLLFSGLSPRLNREIAAHAVRDGGHHPFGVDDLEKDREGAEYVRAIRRLDDLFPSKRVRETPYREPIINRLRGLAVPFTAGRLDREWNLLLELSPPPANRSECYRHLEARRSAGLLERGELVALKECIDAAYAKNFWAQPYTDASDRILPVVSPRKYGALGVAPPQAAFPTYGPTLRIRSWYDAEIAPADLDVVRFRDLANWNPPELDPSALRGPPEEVEQQVLAHISGQLESYATFQYPEARAARTHLAKAGAILDAGGEVERLALAMSHLPAVSIVIPAAEVGALGIHLTDWWIGWRNARRSAAIRRIARAVRQVETIPPPSAYR